METCPRCDGHKTLDAFFKGMHAPMTCYVCNGAGTVTAMQLARIEHGQRIRDYREQRELGLREAANMWGLKPSYLSLIEQGRVTTDWVPPSFEE
jgi:hypothetical protein